MQTVQTRLLLVLPHFPRCKHKITEQNVFGFGAGIYHVDDKGRLLAAPLRLRGLPGEAGSQQGFCHMASRSGAPLT